MAMDCTPAVLLESSKCFKCIPAGEQGAVMIYLLNIIAEKNMTPQQLMDEARCFRCIPAGMQPEVMNYLLCQVVTLLSA